MRRRKPTKLDGKKHPSLSYRCGHSSAVSIPTLVITSARVANVQTHFCLAELGLWGTDKKEVYRLKCGLQCGKRDQSSASFDSCPEINNITLDQRVHETRRERTWL